MNQDIIDWVYRTMNGEVSGEYAMLGVDNAFEPGSYCMKRYGDMLDAYERLCDRLGVVDVDNDVETIIHVFMDIQEELCFRMYQYGAQFGMGEKK